MNYNGSKANCFQRIINYMPPHAVYVETHAGSAAVAKNKEPAQQNILIDIDPTVTAQLTADIDTSVYVVEQADCVDWLHGHTVTTDTLVYSDPPYVMSARSSQRDLYRYEYTDADHVCLLQCLKSLDCMVLISGYDSELYNDMLTGWSVATFTAQSRGGIRTEYLWYNYPEPTQLHDYSHLGYTFTERQRIKRKSQRWSNRFQALPLLERQAIIHQLQTDGIIDSPE